MREVNRSHKRDLENIRNRYEEEITRVEVESEQSTNAEIARLLLEAHAEIQRRLEEANASHKEDLKNLGICYEEEVAS